MRLTFRDTPPHDTPRRRDSVRPSGNLAIGHRPFPESFNDLVVWSEDRDPGIEFRYEQSSPELREPARADEFPHTDATQETAVQVEHLNTGMSAIGHIKFGHRLAAIDEHRVRFKEASETGLTCERSQPHTVLVELVYQ